MLFIFSGNSERQKEATNRARFFKSLVFLQVLICSSRAFSLNFENVRSMRQHAFAFLGIKIGPKKNWALQKGLFTWQETRGVRVNIVQYPPEKLMKVSYQHKDVEAARRFSEQSPSGTVIP
jgi:hypothetical protein